MFRSCEEDDSFTEIQLISFDQQAMCKWLLYLLFCTYVPKHVQFAWMIEKFESVVNNKLIVQRFERFVLKKIILIWELN